MVSLLRPSLDALLEAHVDVTEPGMPVEVRLDERGVLWVNVGPVCLLRVCRTGVVEVVTPKGLVHRTINRRES